MDNRRYNRGPFGAGPQHHSQRNYVDETQRQDRHQQESMSAKKWEEEKQKLLACINKLSLENKVLQVSLQHKVETEACRWSCELNHLTVKLKYRESENGKLKKQNDDLLDKLKEMTSEMRSKEPGFPESEKALETKHKALESEHAALQDKLREKEQIVLSLESRIKLLEDEKKEMSDRQQDVQLMVSQMETQNKEFHDCCLEIQNKAAEEKDSLQTELQDVKEQLTRTKTELHQSCNDWQKKCNTLERTFMAQLSQTEQDWQTNKNQLEKEKMQLVETQQKCELKVKQMESQNKELQELCSQKAAEEKASLQNELQDVTEQLTRTRNEFHQNNSEWQTKCDVLVETFTAELALKERDLEDKDRQLEEKAQLVDSQQHSEVTGELDRIEEEKNNIEEIPSTVIPEKRRKKRFSFKRLFICGSVQEDKTSERIKKELKKKKKEEKKQKKEAEKEMKKQEKLANKEKQAEKKSGFWSRTPRCGSDRKVDEEAGCSAQVDQ